MIIVRVKLNIQMHTQVLIIHFPLHIIFHRYNMYCYLYLDLESRSKFLKERIYF